MQNKTSTPKRNRLEVSDGHIGGIKRQNNQTVNRFDRQASSPPLLPQRQYKVPFEQMRLAVAHNLPCFTINFTDKARKLSVVYIAEQLTVRLF
ncbi:unnamed protein product [Didymodactylos carnosus]|uniref:Uncharacterized protein n=1 Tax=Didymodactylos carnosus TaxID=1234261 RepID=A0A815JGL5_9BILA|nr:unnamed protein product [Didymodactylos carnosus]CAF1627050.1 unnamed protein product [Didymodactylos carnosus]CAF4275245.1 unnamed protein product [Didymodactylos carnosus]CAF4450723.1 unnamed protein product [Didymodactylos carnosus]